MEFFEINFNGITAPYHNYGGLAAGNVASTTSRDLVSYPRQAALQCLNKAILANKLGLQEAILPPQLRPDFSILENAGYKGSKKEILSECFERDPQLLRKVYSSASAWTANAATSAPSIDTINNQLNIIPANLAYNFHRMLETSQTTAVLKNIFSNSNSTINPALLAHPDFGDEGSANHTRLAPSHSTQGLHVFVYGDGAAKPTNYPVRQTLRASRAVASALKIKPEQTIFLQQNPEVIDAGVFHNDVIAVGNENVFLYHNQALADANAIQKLTDAYKKLHNTSPTLIEVSDTELSVEDAVKTYFFNSQIITLPSGKMAFIAPQDVNSHTGANKLVQKIIADKTNPIEAVHYLDLTQSMQNGGGPACLRLRVVVNRQQKQAIAKNARIFIDDVASEIEAWINKFYREELCFNDLAKIELYEETVAALKELSKILKLPLLTNF